ncbi:hypothetical protein ASD80_15220 [Devosia sp. Root635]|nr:hypothetical protein ASD80_15220 [Devosia sp. Root635]
MCNALLLIEKHLFQTGTPEASIPEEVSSMTWIENLDEELASPRRRYFLSIMVLHGINMHVPHPENDKPPLPRPLI